MRKYVGIRVVLLTWGCVAQTPVEKFQNRCEKTEGVFLDCAVAFAEGCSRSVSIEGRNVICACPEGKRWKENKGCIVD